MIKSTTPPLLASSLIWVKTQLVASGGGVHTLCTWAVTLHSISKAPAALADLQLFEPLTINFSSFSQGIISNLSDTTPRRQRKDWEE